MSGPEPRFPLKQELFSVAARPLTDDELQQVAQNVARDAEDVWRDSARTRFVYQKLDTFLGFLIGKEATRIQTNPENHDQFVKYVFDAAYPPFDLEAALKGEE
jgi:hypothetical protein